MHIAQGFLYLDDGKSEGDRGEVLCMFSFGKGVLTMTKLLDQTTMERTISKIEVVYPELVTTSFSAVSTLTDAPLVVTILSNVITIEAGLVLDFANLAKTVTLITLK